MFEFLSWGHVFVIALAALFIFGPERLPTLAQDAARGLKRARSAIDALRGQLADSLGDDLGDLRDLDLRRYHPRTFLHEQLFGERPSDNPGRRDAPPASMTPSRSRPSIVFSRALPPPVDWEAT